MTKSEGRMPDYAPITPAMYDQGQQELLHPRYRSPRRLVVLRLADSPPIEDWWGTAQQQTQTTVRIVDTYWEPQFRGIRGRDDATGLFCTVPVFEGWRCLNPLVTCPPPLRTVLQT